MQRPGSFLLGIFLLSLFWMAQAEVVEAAEVAADIVMASMTFDAFPPVATDYNDYLECKDATSNLRVTESRSCLEKERGIYLCSMNCWDAVSLLLLCVMNSRRQILLCSGFVCFAFDLYQVFLVHLLMLFRR